MSNSNIYDPMADYSPGFSEIAFDNVGSYICFNGRIVETNKSKKKLFDVENQADGAACEVIRIVDGTPLFIEDHCERLNESLTYLNAGKKIREKAILAPIPPLLNANGIKNCNLKIWASVDSSNKINLVYIIKDCLYPPPEYYRNGVPAGLYAYTRENPNVNRVIPGFSRQVQSLIKSGGVYELLLYDESQRMTEGSRSNLFFTRGERLFTAPERIILKGTVRKYVFLAAERAGIEIVERPVTLEEIGLSPGSLDRRRAPEGADIGRQRQQFRVGGKTAHGKSTHGKSAATPTPGPWPGSAIASGLPVLSVSGAFITGAPVGVLPISRIGGVRLGSADDPIISAIRLEYEKIARAYIDSRANI